MTTSFPEIRAAALGQLPADTRHRVRSVAGFSAAVRCGLLREVRLLVNLTKHY
ncbi:hypothetical protein ACWGLF_41330 [Streptomyces puniciscabiei]